MLVSYQWLNDYLDLTAITPKELGDKMSVTGIEVEGIESPADGLKKIVVGFVKECIPHPDSDHLSICQVDVGEEELYQIVCGAPNIKADIKVIVALPNSRITGNVKIKKGKMRGVVSQGMICSLQELGYADNVIPKEYAEGIYYLPQDAVVGEPVFSYLGMEDALIELSITPNRADALSMRGVAYEVGAIYRQTPTFNDEVLVEDATKAASDAIKVTVADKKDAPAYQIRIIEDVKVAASPQWLQNRLMNAGIRPINNVVDVTNYVLLLFGQPLHAFDYQALGSQEIVVRRGHEQEPFVTLDGQERKLSPENIVVTNGEVPVALAGVMGGLDSEVTETTTTVALEAAIFDSVSIRKTSKQFNLRSESSSRFEKGINQATVAEACDVAAAMIAKLAGGRVLQGAVGETLAVLDQEVTITLARINQYLGTSLSNEEVVEIITALGFGVEEVAHTYTVSIPPRRWDITIEADMIEEVARIYGYDNLPSTLPSGETVAGSLTAEQKLIRQIRQIVEGSGLNEAISYALTTEEKSQQFMLRESKLTRLDWPMTEDRSVLRMNLISGLLDDVAYNQARNNNDVAFYEIGNVFYQSGNPKKDLPLEEKHVAFAIAGLWELNDWQQSASQVDYYTVKGILDRLFQELRLQDVIRYEATNQMPDMHPGRTAAIYLGEKQLGFIGQIHPQQAKDYDISETYVVELNLQALVDYQLSELIYQPISKFPAVRRDIAMLVAEDISHQSLVETIKQVAGRFLSDVSLFDIYQGANIEAGKKSMAYRLTFVNPEATLTDEEVTKAFDKVVQTLVETYGVTIR